MKTGRADLDAMVRVTSIPADEPVFIVRAQDEDGAETLRAYAELKITRGTPVEVIELVLRQADAMDAWPIKKATDADFLPRAEAHNLAYEYRRRRWALGARDASGQAEARGIATAIEVLTPVASVAMALTRLPNLENLSQPALLRIVEGLREAARLAIECATSAGVEFEMRP